MNMYYIHIEADVIPGESAAGIPLGASVQDLLRDMPGFFRLSYFAGPSLPTGFMMRYSNPSVEVWASREHVERIVAQGDYAGTFDGAIGIGSTTADLDDRYDSWYIDDSGHAIIDGVPGLALRFDDPAAPGDGGVARVTALIVFHRGKR